MKEYVDVRDHVRAEIAQLPSRHQMKGFVSVTDNDWCAFSSQQVLLPKTPRQSATKPADKKDGGHARHKNGG
jgi:hypothetical protein